MQAATGSIFKKKIVTQIHTLYHYKYYSIQNNTSFSQKSIEILNVNKVEDGCKNCTYFLIYVLGMLEGYSNIST
jgi:hypothetical protein